MDESVADPCFLAAVMLSHLRDSSPSWLYVLREGCFIG